MSEGTSGQGGASFSQRLATAIDDADSLVCVGLDPHPGSVEGSIVDHCRRVIDATAEHAAAFKPNSAFFEAIGTGGLADLKAVIDHIPDGKIVLLDAKRGDMRSTSAAYAKAAFEVLGVDALTVNAYLGLEALEPFTADPTRGAFVLCHTSNPGAAEFQTLEVGGEPLYIRVARACAAWDNFGNVGLVVGATYPEALAAVREVAPYLPILAPGVGAQGGDPKAALAAGLDAAGGGLLVSSSRSIFFADDPGAAARALRDILAAARDAAFDAARDVAGDVARDVTLDAARKSSIEGVSVDGSSGGLNGGVR